MSFYIVIQKAVANISMPSMKELKQWSTTVLQKKVVAAEMTVRIVDKREIQQLNKTYRHKNKPTNVLSFPFETPKDIHLEIPILGDIVICAEIVNQEAREQGKTEKAHWAHMLTHGILHLLGYDHENVRDAERMENEEKMILHGLGFPNPYQIIQEGKKYE
jgi:probable rRNA maturation factor